MNSFLDRLNLREIRLLVITLAVLTLGGAFFAGRAALATVRELDGKIADQELEMENLKQQTVQADSVNSAYARVVKQHSSAFTEAEIADNLRREIVRLTQVDLPATADKPARTMKLVGLPALPEGQLTQGKGHRDYQIRFQIPGARLDFLLTFLERIEESELLLRIDNLDIGRPPDSNGVSASVEITRTVLDNPEEAGRNAKGTEK